MYTRSSTIHIREIPVCMYILNSKNRLKYASPTFTFNTHTVTKIIQFNRNCRDRNTSIAIVQLARNAQTESACSDHRGGKARFDAALTIYEYINIKLYMRYIDETPHSVTLHTLQMLFCFCTDTGIYILYGEKKSTHVAT